MAKNLPEAPTVKPHNRIKPDLSMRALELWNPALKASDSDGNDIGIFDVIGEDVWSEGVTAKRISAALRRIGSDNPVTVNINSPGGDLFEGLAIYNLLREHKGEVTVRVMGLAASAASVIAMAGDRVEVSRAGFFMIHNAWVMAIGNRQDLIEVSNTLEPFDRAMGSIYEARTGLDKETIESMMDRETWICGSDAIEQSFADAYLPADQIEEDAKACSTKIAARKLDLAMAKSGIPRSERRSLLNELKSSTHDAVGTGTHDAAEDDTPSAVMLEQEPIGKKLTALSENFLKKGEAQCP